LAVLFQKNQKSEGHLIFNKSTTTKRGEKKKQIATNHRTHHARLANRIAMLQQRIRPERRLNENSTFPGDIESAHKSNYSFRAAGLKRDGAPEKNNAMCCQSISSIGNTSADIRFRIDTLRRGDFVSPPFLLCEMASSLK
jgi:hypothetical protein